MHSEIIITSQNDVSESIEPIAKETHIAKETKAGVTKVTLYLSFADISYIRAIARKKSESEGNLLLKVVRQFINGQILNNKITEFQPEHDTVIPILKALIHKKLDSAEKITPLSIKRAAKIINCEESQIYKLLKTVGV